MSSRIPLIAGNWKMFKTCRDAVTTAANLVKLVEDIKDREVMIAPPFTALHPVAAVLNESQISLGAQNLFWEKEGAYTGEISAAMLASVGCRYVIIGHSERRQYFNDTDETVNRRLQAAIKGSLIPVLCVGESEKERDSGKTFSVLDKQLKIGLKGLFAKDLEKLVIAYEPVWAIGTGKTASSSQAQEAHEFLRLLLKKCFGSKIADSTRILYGGSVKPGNIAELMRMQDVDGALVGGASLDETTFSAIVHY